ncbi:secondary thiamine-phosphate synthase [Salipiger aestuarii]|uniref:Secondary thiamine-phosphate synthase enzyme n=1 Tax=Salipiger aestuarii TaxID=568098 RepID=A0A327YGQ0_9RHOB|nr:secondary thiamine-phosphate synthase enzyme YjbQ [Salipiger aestuarii]KAB2542517.1 secondary thiamine-phosphate synthase [Salipiger aestuarii]RAK18985.1 secondary thiamine-phosphate synthase enzyme [Salipiger aestuarii]
MQTSFTLSTHGQGLYEFTRDVAAWVRSGDDPRSGLLTLFIRHTSASLVIQENTDPEVRTDLSAFFQRLVPPATDATMGYLKHTLEGPDDMPAHIKAALLPVSLSIPVLDGHMRLGTWQGIYLFEHRDAPKRRDVIAHLSR